MEREAKIKMRKILTYGALIIELFIALALGVFSCINGANMLVITLSGFLLVASFLATVFLIISAQGFTKSAANLLFAIVHLFLNRLFIGLVFGWESCPMV